MSIDLFTETVVPLGAYPDHVPKLNGRRLHRTAAYRYAKRGVRGVKLEVVQLPSGLCTSREAIQRFIERLTQARNNSQPPLKDPARKDDRQQHQVEAEIAEVRASLRKRGGR